MRSQPSNVITWIIPVVLAAILACTLVMPLNAQTQSSQKGPAQAPPKAVRQSSTSCRSSDPGNGKL